MMDLWSGLETARTMGQQCRSESLSYYFRIEDHVSEHHLLRAIDRYVNFDLVREKLHGSD
jgi:hypothetical protein